MKCSKTTNEPHRYESVNYQNNGGRGLDHCFPYGGILSSHYPCDVDPAETKNVYTKESR